MAAEREILAHLADHPGWTELCELAQERMRKEFLHLATEQMTGLDVPYHTIQYRRGFFAGMKFLLDVPQLEANKLRIELAKMNGGST